MFKEVGGLAPQLAVTHASHAWKPHRHPEGCFTSFPVFLNPQELTNQTTRHWDSKESWILHAVAP